MQENNKAEEEAEEETNDEDDEGFDFRFAKHRKGWLNRTFRVGEVQDDTTMMLVTHLAPAILEATGRNDLRVDGILKIVGKKKESFFS